MPSFQDEDDFAPARPRRSGATKKKKKKLAAWSAGRVFSLLAMGFFGLGGTFLLGITLLRAGRVVYYNLQSGPIAHTGGLDRKVDDVSLSVMTFVLLIGTGAAGIMALLAAARWKDRDTREGMKLSVFSFILLMGGPAIHVLFYGPPRPSRRSVAQRAFVEPRNFSFTPPAPRTSTPSTPPAATPITTPAPAPAALPAPALAAARATPAETSNDPMIRWMKTSPPGTHVSLILSASSAADGPRIQSLLAQEFRGLPDYVPESVIVHNNIVHWKVNIPFNLTKIEEHKAAATAILRTNNISVAE